MFWKIPALLVVGLLDEKRVVDDLEGAGRIGRLLLRAGRSRPGEHEHDCNQVSAHAQRMSPPGRAAQPRARTGHDLRFYDRGWPRYAHGVARLRDSIATPAGKAPYVRRLFATIADRYDLITVWLSYGQDRRWKRQLVASAGPLQGRRVLDLACGTGDIAWLAAARGAHVVGLDITPRMIELARAKAPAHRDSRRGAGVPRRRHVRPARARRLIRHRHHRLRPAQRARSPLGRPRDRARAAARRPVPVARFQSPGQSSSSAMRITPICRPWAARSGGRCTAIPIRTATSPNRSAPTRVRPRSSTCCGERIHRRALAARARGLDGDSRGHAPIVAPSVPVDR